MFVREDILNELTAVSETVASVSKINVFTVDAGYFEGIEAEIKARITADTFRADREIFSVPQGYFESLESGILQKIKREEKESSIEEMMLLSPMIAGIGNQNVFTVPAGYFEQSTIPAVLKPVATVVKMGTMRRIYKYAAAAVITGLIGIGIVNIVNTDNDAGPAASGQLAGILKKAESINKNNTFETELNSVSDGEIEQYLAQNGQDVNASLVASVTDDESKLPEATDYLLDENALDNFLNTNNLEN